MANVAFGHLFAYSGVANSTYYAGIDLGTTPRVTRIIPFSGDMAIEDLIPNGTETPIAADVALVFNLCFAI